MLDNVRLPSAEIDMPLKEYAKLVCALLDIPVHNSVMEPLHLLFSLFSDFKARARPARDPRGACQARTAALRNLSPRSPVPAQCARADAPAAVRAPRVIRARVPAALAGERAFPAAVHRRDGRPAADADGRRRPAANYRPGRIAQF